MSWNMPVNFHLSRNGLWPGDIFREFALHFYNNSFSAFPSVSRVTKRGDCVDPQQLREEYIKINEFCIQSQNLKDKVYFGHPHHIAAHAQGEC